MALFANLAEFKQAVADVQQPMEDVTRQFLGDKVDAAALRVLNGQQAMEDVTRDFLKDRIKEASPAEIALQVNAAGIAKEVQAELIKLIGGAK